MLAGAPAAGIASSQANTLWVTINPHRVVGKLAKLRTCERRNVQVVGHPKPSGRASHCFPLSKNVFFFLSQLGLVYKCSLVFSFVVQCHPLFM